MVELAGGSLLRGRIGRSGSAWVPQKPWLLPASLPTCAHPASFGACPVLPQAWSGLPLPPGSWLRRVVVHRSPWDSLSRFCATLNKLGKSFFFSF